MSDQTVLPRLVWPGRAHDEPELDQPLMVVVLVVLARAATPARVAVAVFRANGRAANIELYSTGLKFCETYTGSQQILQQARS